MNKTNNGIKLAILSLSSITIMAGAAVAPVLGKISKVFNDVPLTYIKLVVTIPAISIILTSIFMFKFAQKFKEKRLIVIGLLIYVFAGIGGGFGSTIKEILVCRFLLGIGVGLFMPYATSLVVKYFEESKRKKMLGVAYSISNLGGIIGVYGSSVLASYNWRYSFFTYLLAVPILILIVIYLPSKNDIKNENKDKPTDKLPSSIIKFGLSAVFIMIAFYAVPANLSIYITQSKIGGSKFSGILITLLSASAFVFSYFFGKFYKVLKRYIVSFALIILFCGYIILAVFKIPFAVISSMMLIGCGIGLLMPNVNSLVAAHIPSSQNDKAMSVISGCVYFGQFISPVFFDFAVGLFTKKTIPYTFHSIGIGVLVLSFVFLVVSLRKRKVELSEEM